MQKKKQDSFGVLSCFHLLTVLRFFWSMLQAYPHEYTLASIVWVGEVGVHVKVMAKAYIVLCAGPKSLRLAVSHATGFAVLGTACSNLPFYLLPVTVFVGNNCSRSYVACWLHGDVSFMGEGVYCESCILRSIPKKTRSRLSQVLSREQ